MAQTSMDKSKDKEICDAPRRPNKNTSTEKGAKEAPELQAAPYLHLVLAKAPINNRDVDAQQSADSGEKKRNLVKNKIDESNDRPKKKKKRKLKLNTCDEELVFTKKVKTHTRPTRVEPNGKIEKTKKKSKIDINDPNEIKQRCSLLKNKMLERLSGSQFRFLNEKLYKTTSDEAYKFFTEDPSLYQVYHNGYQIQMAKWPVKPLDIIVKEIKSRSKSLVVADFGCGDASLAARVTNTVHSFDLVALNDRVTECDMAHVPLEDRSVDIAVFCLSLMGTNFIDYLVEANRVLKFNGLLKIAEIKARFKSTEIFTKIIQRLGFKLLNKDESHKMFVYFNLKKLNGITKGGLPKLKLKPCVYKKR
uniref:Ribosomal RNA-processing protein 8 n=1 Tax=Strigamia maritima TaxID=126957 RepID=T1JBQ7_STRMM